MSKWLICCLCLFSTVVHANNNLGINYSIFGTLGLTLSDSAHYGYRNSISADRGVYQDDIDLASRSLIGLQLDSQLNNQLDLVIQAVFKDLPDPKAEQYLSMAFARYSPTPQWHIRLGRIPPNLFLVAEFKNIDYGYLWATVPQEVYSLIPYQHIDGIDINHSLMLGDSTINTTFFAGVSEAEISTTRGSDRIDLTNIFGLSFSFEHGNWLIQARHSQLEVAEENDDSTQLITSISAMPPPIWPNAIQFAQQLRIKGKNYGYSSLGGQWYLGAWQLTAEFVHITADTIVVPNINSGYFSSAYQYDSANTFYGLIASTQSKNYRFNQPEVNSQIPGVPQLIAGVLALNNLYASNQNSLSLGWRKEINDNIATSVQWTHTKIDKFGGTLWLAPENSPISEHINSIFANVGFVW